MEEIGCFSSTIVWGYCKKSISEDALYCKASAVVEVLCGSKTLQAENMAVCRQNIPYGHEDCKKRLEVVKGGVE